MKTLINFISLILLSLSSFSQIEMELRCLNEISTKSKNIAFPINSNPTFRKADTIHFDKSLIFLRSSSEEAFQIFSKGLLFPELIIGSNMGQDGEFGKTSNKFIGTLNISSFVHLKTPTYSPTTRAFSFLIWQKNVANPMLYILQLTNENASSSTNLSEFIEGSKVTAFGFCSILI